MMDTQTAKRLKMNTLSDFWHRHQIRVVAAATIILLLSLAYWGGFPSHVAVGTLAFGLAFLIGVVMFFGFLVYYFYIAPLSEKEQRSLAVSTPSSKVRYIVGTGATIAATFIAVGLFWDELWHRLYGVGAVINDFFWRPHILLYAGMGINAIFALGGMFIIMRHGKGTLRQRFRADPLIGLLTLAAGFQVITAPLDPMWHQIYGLDITAWSLPHLLLGLGIVSVMLVGSSIQFASVERRPWRIVGSLSLNEILAMALLALGATMLFQFGTTEWENIGTTIDPTYSFFQRPEWLYPVVLISLSLFIGMAALHLTRRIGSATLVFILTLLLRLLLMSIFNASQANMSYKANLLTLPPLIALDLWYAYRLRTGRIDQSSTPLGGSLVLALATFVITLPLIKQMLFYPRLYPTVVIGMVVFGLLMAVAAGWAGSHVGAWLRTLGQSQAEQPVTAPISTQRVFWIGAGALVAVLAFIVVFISTATPPLL
jgi:hypothetical protein